MADNVSVTAGSGTTIAADDVDGALHQRVKISHGADGSATDASSTAPLPVSTINGQTTVAAGTGTVGTTVQRVTVATDDTVATDLTAIKNATQVIDDWDESDRAKVNPIVGQAGVAAGAGAVGVTVQRTTLASDDPAVTALQIIDDWDESDRAKVNIISGQAGVAANTGTISATTQRVTIATDDTIATDTAAIKTSVQLLDDVIFADDAAFTPATSKVAAVGMMADETATDSVNEDDIGIPRITLDRKQHVVAELEISSMRAAGTALTPKFAAIAAATSGDNSLVSAVSGKKIRVLSLFVLAGAAGNVYFTSAAAGTVIFGGSTNKINLPINGGFVLPFNPVGWFENSSANQAIVMNASSTGPFSGGLVYVEV